VNLLIQSLKNLHGISISLDENKGLLKARNKLNSDLICSINYTAHNFQSYTSNNYNDLLRVLTWFKIKDINSENNNSKRCNPLGCENCNGCQYSALTKLYNARKVLLKYLSQDIIYTYIFIGSSKLEDLIHYTTTFKKYIYIKDRELLVLSFAYDAHPPSWKSSALVRFDRPYYIDEFIPEVLKIPDFISQVYGIYDGDAGIWKRERLNNRLSWVFEKLNH
jgi:hypothetical protein